MFKLLPKVIKIAVAAAVAGIVVAGYLLLRVPSWLILVGDHPFYQEEFEADRDLFFSDLPFSPHDVSLSSEAAATVFLSRWIDEKLILARAADLNLTIPQEEVDAEIRSLREDLPEELFQSLLVERKISLEALRQRVREEIIIQAVMEKESSSITPVREEEIESYYLNHQADFFSPISVRALQITVKNEEAMVSLVQSLMEGVSFEKLMARREVEGIEMGLVSQGDLPAEFEAVLFSLKIGEESQPIRTPYGIHLFKVTDRQEAHLLTLEECSSRIREKLETARRAASQKSWLQELKDQYPVVINRRHPLLKGLTFPNEDFS